MSGFILETDLFKGTMEVNQIRKLKLNIMNFRNDLLIAHPEESTATFESDVDAEAEQATFYLNIYEEFAGHKIGEPVAISCKVDNKNYLLCVASDSVILKESEVPEEIPSEACELIFYQRDCSDTSSTFESSVKSGFFLACSEDGWNLILKPYSEEPFMDIKVFKQHEPMNKTPYHFRNIPKDLLIAQPEKSVATFEPEGPANVEQALFYENRYKEYAMQTKGIPVIFSCEVDKKNYLLCVANNSVILKESELPERIPTKESELIFYKTVFSTGHSYYRFQSSINPRSFLTWNIEDPEKKLTLKHPVDDLDETTGFYLETQN